MRVWPWGLAVSIAWDLFLKKSTKFPPSSCWGKGKHKKTDDSVFSFHSQTRHWALYFTFLTPKHWEFKQTFGWCHHKAISIFHPFFTLLYSTLYKITQFWLVESITINPKLYSVGVAVEFPWKRRVRKKNGRQSLRNFNGFIFTK